LTWMRVKSDGKVQTRLNLLRIGSRSEMNIGFSKPDTILTGKITAFWEISGVRLIKSLKILWDITPCFVLKANRHSKGTEPELCLLNALCCFLAWLVLRSWRRRRHVAQKRRLTFIILHAVMSQKRGPFITTAVRTSHVLHSNNLTKH
jgi:hypothetical protein